MAYITGEDRNQIILFPEANELDSNDQEEAEMIVEHPFGTVKRIWGYNHFLTRGLVSVNTENKLHLLAYNLRRVISIMGVEEMVRRLTLA
ncbi:MAG: transposase [Desulfitobacteriaceae bacterium]|nr:transposase [Desulfitobacteriaceae bacterium]